MSDQQREEAEHELYATTLNALVEVVKAWTEMKDHPTGNRSFRLPEGKAKHLAVLCYQCGIPMQTVFEELEKTRRYEHAG